MIENDIFNSETEVVSLDTVVVVHSISHVHLFATPWTAAHQASLSKKKILWTLNKAIFRVSKKKRRKQYSICFHDGLNNRNPNKGEPLIQSMWYISSEQLKHLLLFFSPKKTIFQKWPIYCLQEKVIFIQRPFGFPQAHELSTSDGAEELPAFHCSKRVTNPFGEL